MQAISNQVLQLFLFLVSRKTRQIILWHGYIWHQIPSNIIRYELIGITIMYLHSRKAGWTAKHYLFSSSDYWQHVLYSNSLFLPSFCHSPHSIKCSQYISFWLSHKSIKELIRNYLNLFHLKTIEQM